MKRLETILVIASAVAMMASCGGNNQKVPFDSGDSVSVIVQDQTVYGICGDGSAMNTLQLLVDNGDTLTLDLTSARDNNQVMGGVQAGDRMAVMVLPGKNEAMSVINLSTLLGRWVMPNPIDGSDEIGISIKEGGIAESIDQSAIVYKTWKIVNGKLEITSVRDGGGDEEEIALFDIVTLGADSLVYKNEEDTYEYTRERPKELYGTEVELEGVSEEDYKI